MAGVALDGSTIAPSTKAGHVTYTEMYQNGTDWWGNPIYLPAPGVTDAVINGITHSNSHVIINGKSVAIQGDTTSENWEASPPPKPTRGGWIESIRPTPDGKGSGTGSVNNSGSHVKINGVPVALTGTGVTTCLGTSTTLNSGSDFVNVT
ncbi:hypothetical protein [Paenibacillus chitinolyticus]|uniref:hypothetical protein n=1 Tax=Paenibacillus chitinolyticus TaxID=79263 RepID=UPI001C43B318|nr:hypothetical protein [Paenibacillus chitinolyticus]